MKISVETKADKKPVAVDKKPAPPKGKISRGDLTDILDDISTYFMRDGYKRFRAIRNEHTTNVNDEAQDYDKNFSEYTGFTECLRDSGRLGRCFCAKCLMEEMLALDMIADDSDYIMDNHGHKLRPVCRYKHEPIVVKRDGRYYLLVRSKVHNFNVYYPIVDVMKEFY